MINDSNNYKCRSNQLSIKEFYHQETGKSLDELKQSEVDDAALKYAKEKERVAMMTGTGVRQVYSLNRKIVYAV